MAIYCKHFNSVLKSTNFSNLWKGCFFRLYSQFDPKMQDPIVNKEELKNLFKTQNVDVLTSIPRKPPINDLTCSILYNKDVKRFIKIMMRKGRKEKARADMDEAFSIVKHTQLRKYNEEKNEELKKEIILNPLEVFYAAVKNATPFLKTLKIKKSGSWYRVPTSISPNHAQFMAMRWIIETAKEKNRFVSLPQRLANALLSSSNNEGKSVQKKIELHKICEANRGYAHYKWT